MRCCKARALLITCSMFGISILSLYSRALIPITRMQLVVTGQGPNAGSYPSNHCVSISSALPSEIPPNDMTNAGFSSAYAMVSLTSKTSIALAGGAADAKRMPRVGFGTCCRNASKGRPLIESTKSYLRMGGRLIDTAQMYDNHQDLAQAIQESGIPREELWVTSKVNTWRGKLKSKEDTLKAVDTSLEELGLQYLDLMLIHGDYGNTQSIQRAVWRGLIEAQRAGKVRNIGVSNYNRQEIEDLEKATGVLPVVNQMEFHPWLPKESRDIFTWCKSRGITVTAYGSLGGSNNKAGGEAAGHIATRKGVSPAQVLLRWALDQGAAVIPGATSVEHICDNLDIKDFQLDAEDIELLEGSERPDAFRRWKNRGRTPRKPGV